MPCYGGCSVKDGGTASALLCLLTHRLEGRVGRSECSASACMSAVLVCHEGLGFSRASSVQQSIIMMLRPHAVTKRE